VIAFVLLFLLGISAVVLSIANNSTDRPQFYSVSEATLGAAAAVLGLSSFWSPL
jgi:hypothetical protein